MHLLSLSLLPVMVIYMFRQWLFVCLVSICFPSWAVVRIYVDGIPLPVVLGKGDGESNDSLPDTKNLIFMDLPSGHEIQVPGARVAGWDDDILNGLYRQLTIIREQEESEKNGGVVMQAANMFVDEEQLNAYKLAALALFKAESFSGDTLRQSELDLPESLFFKRDDGQYCCGYEGASQLSAEYCILHMVIRKIVTADNSRGFDASEHINCKMGVVYQRRDMDSPVLINYYHEECFNDATNIYLILEMLANKVVAASDDFLYVDKQDGPASIQGEGSRPDEKVIKTRLASSDWTTHRDISCGAIAGSLMGIQCAALLSSAAVGHMILGSGIGGGYLWGFYRRSVIKKSRAVKGVNSWLVELAKPSELPASSTGSIASFCGGLLSGKPVMIQGGLRLRRDKVFVSSKGEEQVYSVPYTSGSPFDSPFQKTIKYE